MKNFTLIPNEILGSSQLSIQARYLHLVLMKHCGQAEHCYPSQRTLAEALGCSSRHIRNLLQELIVAGLVSITRSGYNRPNTYKVAKQFIVKNDRNSSSYHLGSLVPIYQGTVLPPKNTYTKVKGKSRDRNMQQIKDVLMNKGIIPKKSPY